MASPQNMQSSVSAVDLAPLPLGAAEGDALRELLRHIKTKHGYKYSEIAQSTKIKSTLIHAITGNRSNGNSKIKNAVFEFCAKKTIAFEYFFQSHENVDLENTDIDDTPVRFFIGRAAAEKSAKAQAGTYLMFTLARTDKINATWYQFMPHTGGPMMPKFSAWRLNKNETVTEFSGSYYLSNDALSMLGINEQGSMRLSTLISRHNPSYHGDRYGFTSGSSEAEDLFAVPCYLKKLQDSDLKEDNLDVIGQRTPEEAQVLFPDVWKYLDKLRQLPYSVERSSSL